MRTALKILAGAFALVVVVVIGVAIALATVDVNTLIGPVKDRVKAATGRDLAVNGGAHLALSLEPRLVLDDVTLSNAPWASGKDMISARQLELQVALLPLLSRRFELVELALVEPTIALEVDAQGRRNWDTAPTPTAVAPGTAAPSFPPGFAAGNVGITNGLITFRDGASGGVTRIAVTKLLVHARNPSSPISAEFRGAVNDIPIAVEGTLGPAADLLARRWPYPVSLQGEVAGQKAALSTKVKAVDQQYSLDDLKFTLGTNSLTGSFAVAGGGPRPKFLFDLRGPALALDALPVPVATAAPPPSAQGSAPKPAHAWLIPDTPVNFAPLRMADAEGSLAIGRLTLANGREYDNLRVALALDAGRLDVSSFSVATLGGTVAGSFAVDASRPAQAVLRARLTGKDLAAGALLALIGQKRDVKGGKTDVSLDLAAQGNSPHAWASSATGNFRLVTGPATLANPKVDPNSSLDKFNLAINPFRASDPTTELRCTVVRFPIKNGIAHVDRSIAMETAKLGVSASGTIDFRNETLDFTFAPKVRKGIPFDVSNFANLVGVSGPFASPQVKIDPVGSAKAIASIGAAVGTGGLSALGQTLFAWAESTGPGPCAIAEGAAQPPTATGASAKGAMPAGGTDPVTEVGKALGRLFGK
jgi:uncharacterized protein involved in outer membrane biogenesis